MAEWKPTKKMKSESEEFRCHTHPIYLTYPVTQKQNMPSGHKKKAQPLTDLLSVFFFPCSFLFPLALFFKVTWAQTQCSGSSDSQRISNYHGKPSFYVWVYLKRRPVEIHNEFILNKPTVTGRAQFEESEYWYKKLLETYHCMSQVAVWKNIKYWI